MLADPLVSAPIFMHALCPVLLGVKGECLAENRTAGRKWFMKYLEMLTCKPPCKK